MPVLANTVIVYLAAALLEIAGCFAFWAWLRSGASPFWLIPGVAGLVGFAWLLTLAPADHAGRAFAAYGGIYVAASLLWLLAVEGRRPDLWDIAGGGLAVAGALLVIFGPRALS
jgi:small multidrug resistance family-3 protein